MKIKHDSIKFKFLIITCLILLLFCLGYLRTSFIVNFTDPNYSFLISRNELSTDNAFDSPVRWISLLFFTTLFISITSLIVYLLYHKKKHLLISLFFYGIMILLAFMFTMIGISFKINAGLEIGNRLKNLLQEPFLTFFIIAYCIYDHSRKL